MPREEQFWTETEGKGPLLATALHAGHEMRPELAAICAIDDATRRREEDAYTDRWTPLLAENRINPRRTRFEVDLNRPRDEAVYLTPADSWGLQVWRRPPSAAMIARSLAEYDAFYERLRHMLDRLVARHHKVAIYEVHSYNHRRHGPHAPPEDPALNPDVNLGTGTMDRDYWAPLVERFMDDLRHHDFPGGPLDVRENVKFHGRYFPYWVHQHYPETVCVLSIEVKKFFMDEWSGKVDEEKFAAVGEALRSTVAGVEEVLKQLGGH